MASEANRFEQVFKAELDDVRKRRQESELWTKAESDNCHDDQLKRELSGMALSGGGVRSAAISLGLIQGLYTRGRMKEMDYLSHRLRRRLCGSTPDDRSCRQQVFRQLGGTDGSTAGSARD